MSYGFNHVRKLWMMLIVLCAAATAGLAQGQTASEGFLNPPDWIQGGWRNMAESDTRRKEMFSFTPHGITLTEGLVPVKKVVDFSREYEGYRVKETVEATVEAKTYRVEFYRSEDSFVYEFKLCEVGACKTGMTYSITRNNRVVRSHITSIQHVLFK